MDRVKVLVSTHDSILLLGGWPEMEACGPDAIFLLPVRHVKVSPGHHELKPVGRVAGATTEIELESIE